METESSLHREDEKFDCVQFLTSSEIVLKNAIDCFIPVHDLGLNRELRYLRRFKNRRGSQKMLVKLSVIHQRFSFRFIIESASGGIRTPGLVGRNHLLYPLSYRSRMKNLSGVTWSPSFPFLEFHPTLSYNSVG